MARKQWTRLAWGFVNADCVIITIRFDWDCLFVTFPVRKILIMICLYLLSYCRSLPYDYHDSKENCVCVSVCPHSHDWTVYPMTLILVWYLCVRVYVHHGKRTIGQKYCAWGECGRKVNAQAFSYYKLLRENERNTRYSTKFHKIL